MLTLGTGMLMLFVLGCTTVEIIPMFKYSMYEKFKLLLKTNVTAVVYEWSLVLIFTFSNKTYFCRNKRSNS